MRKASNERTHEEPSCVGTIIIAIVAVLSVLWAVIDSTVSSLRDEVRRSRNDIERLHQDTLQGFDNASQETRSILPEYEHTESGVKVPLR